MLILVATFVGGALFLIGVLTGLNSIDARDSTSMLIGLAMVIVGSMVFGFGFKQIPSTEERQINRYASGTQTAIATVTAPSKLQTQVAAELTKRAGE